MYKYFTMKIATAKERIVQFIDYKGISKQSFFKETGLKRGFLDADKLQTSIPDVFVATIIATYPELNPEWLITGVGEMLRNTFLLQQTAKEGGEIVDFKNRPLPLVTTEEVANNHTGSWLHKNRGFCLPNFTDVDFLFQVRGIAMYPRYNNGDIVVCRLSDDKPVWQWNRIYVLKVSKREVFVRRVQQGRDFDHILLVPENPEYQPVEIRVDQVNLIAIVEGVLHFE